MLKWLLGVLCTVGTHLLIMKQVQSGTLILTSLGYTVSASCSVQVRVSALSWSPVEEDLVVSGDEKGTIVSWRLLENRHAMLTPESGQGIVSLACSTQDKEVLAVGWVSEWAVKVFIEWKKCWLLGEWVIKVIIEWQVVLAVRWVNDWVIQCVAKGVYVRFSVSGNLFLLVEQWLRCTVSDEVSEWVIDRYYTCAWNGKQRFGDHLLWSFLLHVWVWCKTKSLALDSRLKLIVQT